MDANKAARELAVIRELMERPIRYSTMSGLSGVYAGIVVLLGLLVDDYVTNHYPSGAIWINLGVWAGIAVLAASGVLVLTRLREKKQGMPAWSRIKAQILLTILPCVIAGVGLTLVIVWRYHIKDGPNQWGLIPAIWMTFYGVCLWQLGGFTAFELRLLGAVFVLAGIVCALFFQFSPYWALGITFGGFHIVYGLIVYLRHGG